MKRSNLWVTPEMLTSILIAVVVLLPLKVFAVSFYHPETPVEILTEVTVQDIPGSPTTSRLTVRSAESSKHLVFLEFFDSQRQEITGRVEFSPNGSVTWNGAHTGGNQLQAPGLLIIPGISIPLDVLPVERFISGEEAEIFQFQRKARGRTFQERIRISAYPVEPDQARQEDWIKVEGKPPAVLYMIEATDADTGNLVARQLWSPEYSWWLYEQTPFRRSWLLQ